MQIATDDQFAPLLRPGRIGKLELKNRVIMVAMGTLTDNPDGTMSPRQIDYLEERASGGAGLIISNGQFVTNRFDAYSLKMTALGTELQTQAWRSFGERVGKAGAKSCVQLSIGTGRVGFAIPGVNADIVAPSELPVFFNPSQITRPYTGEEIRYLVECSASAASRAREAGLDAIEIHGHVGYLLDQFMSEIWNFRTDEYGGSFENRMRLPREIIAATRAAAGPDMALIYRFSLDHRFKGGRSVEDGLDILRHLEQETSIDAFNISVGAYDSHHLISFAAYMGDAPALDSAAIAKANSRLPIINAANMTPEAGADALRAGKLDFVGMGRPLIADPELVNKIAMGRRDDVVPCIRCNEYCMSVIELGMVATCAVNARASSERDYPMIKTSAPKRVLVIGGGPAGLEAARVAAEKGHIVDLYEKSANLGSIMRFATASFKTEILRYYNYLLLQMKELGVSIHLQSELSAMSPELADADEIIVAVGSTLLSPGFPGAERTNVMSITEAFGSRRAEIGGRVVILGGDKYACDTALELAMEGKTVTVIEPSDTIMASAHRDDKSFIILGFEEYNVTLLLSHNVVEFALDHAILAGPENIVTEVGADTFLYQIGMEPNAAVAEEVLVRFPHARIVGDCDHIGSLGAAVRAGFFAAYAIN